MRSILSNFIENFMEKKVVVSIGNTKPQEEDISWGIPQGSTRFYACFIIAMNDIETGLPDNVNTSLYVDDFAIYASGSLTRKWIDNFK